MDKQNTSTQGGDANETDGAQADVASGHGPSQYTPNGPFHSTASGPNLPPTAPVSGHQVYLTLSEAVTGPDGRNVSWQGRVSLPAQVSLDAPAPRTDGKR